MTYVGVVSLPVRRSRSSCLIDISQSYRSKTRVTDVTPRLLVSSDWILCITTSHRSLNVSNFDSSSAWSRAVPSVMYAVWLSWDTASAWILSQLDSNFLAKSALVVFRIVPSSLKREVVQVPVRETTPVLRWHLSALTQPGAVEIGLQNPSLFCLFCWMSERYVRSRTSFGAASLSNMTGSSRMFLSCHPFPSGFQRSGFASWLWIHIATW